GVYLITGGLGGLGYQCAQYLARRYAAKVILTGRRVLDAERAAQVEGLRALGGEGLYVRADVSDAVAMRHALQVGEARFGAVVGVIHAAGVQSSGSVLTDSAATMSESLASKVSGTRVVSAVVKDSPSVEFVCAFASTAAVLGDFGACTYAVGNRY